MLNKLRGFSNSKLAMVVVGIIIVPFIFWGMGSVFSGGNTNNIAKINNETISTKDFINHINNSRLTNEVIKANIDKNILERILSDLISQKILDMEIKKLNVNLSEKSLVNKIKSNSNFLDDKNNFSRIKYEKFLLENNLSAPNFETRLKNQELKRNLFNYISGGIKSPYFLKNKYFISEQKKVEISYFDLDLANDNTLTSTEINNFIEENKEMLKEDYIDFSYVKITPKDLVEINEFNDEFFKKIDDIENSILNGLNISQIKKDYNLQVKNYNQYRIDKNSEDILKFIYSKRNEDKIQLVDKSEYFLLFEISKIDKILPNTSDEEFLTQIKNNLILKKKYEFNKDIYQKIEDKKFNNNDFIKIAKNKNNIKKAIINNINDKEIFDEDSVKLIYSLPKESFVLITGNNNKIFLANLKKIISKNLDKNSSKTEEYGVKSNNKIINEINSSYDFSLNSKYKVRTFNDTMERVKNYFR
tara:strand:- start:3894 stop:5315 length:1422 start_codon:yes stop_codon:yes gene_type:complete